MALEGLYLHGEYLGLRDRKPREVGDRTFLNVDVGLRVHGVVVAVQYPSRERALEAVVGLEVEDPAALRVVQRSGTNKNGPWSFFAGVVVGGGPSEEDFAG